MHKTGQSHFLPIIAPSKGDFSGYEYPYVEGKSQFSFLTHILLW